MIISKRLEDASLLCRKDELTYSAVIEDFKMQVRYIFLTYNISKDQNVLLKALKDCEKIQRYVLYQIFRTLGILFWKNLCR